MAHFTQTELDFLINHLFLPPKLPQADDHDVQFDDSLLRLVNQSLDEFVQLLPVRHRTGAEKVAGAVCRLTDLRDADGYLEEEKLLRCFQDLGNCENGTTIPLYIAVQNAGVLISKSTNGVDFEAFELSATNKSVMSTTGRLRRCFPGPALTIEAGHFQEEGFRATFAQALGTMSAQKAPNMTPTARKSQQEVEEIRDTSHPGLITELQISFLMPISKPCNVQRLWKNSREEVLWKKAFVPWRRSPLWLHLRVTMQLLFDRFRGSDYRIADHTAEPNPSDLFKLFMVFVLAKVLKEALNQSDAVDLDLVHCMSAKITRRMLKLEAFDGQPGIGLVKAVLEESEALMSQRWQAAEGRNARILDLAPLSFLKFGRDVELSLPGLDEHIVRMLNRKPISDCLTFSPSSELEAFPASALPGANFTCASAYKPYSLFGLEEWVSRHLRAWLAGHLGQPSTCSDLGKLLQSYHGEATQLDLHNPERRSIIFLTLLEIWMALDDSAIAQFPMLRDYNPGLPLEHVRCLILPKKDHMIRLRRFEEYVQQRQTLARYKTPGSIFRDFGSPHCLATRFFDNSRKHQDLRTRIEAAAGDARRRKLEELTQKKAQYEYLMRKSGALTCEYRQIVASNGHRRSVHARNCQKCSYRDSANSIDIQIYEWPLPIRSLDVKTVIFELDPPLEFCEWRDATMFLLQNVLGSKYKDLKKPRASFPLKTYDALRPYLSRHLTQSPTRIGLLSEDKPHAVTHRNTKLSMSGVTEKDVCLNNGLHFYYFDVSLGSFVSEVSHTDAVLQLCTYSLPSSSRAALQNFLTRRFQGQDSTSNEVISKQSECPDHLSLAEFRSLASIPVGYRLGWMNVLAQLFCPLVDFKKLETALVILQVIYQAGPLEIHDFRRAGHRLLADDDFAYKILGGVQRFSIEIQENWESIVTLSTLISIVGRLISLTTPATRALATTNLSRLRTISFRWVQMLKKKFETSRSDTQAAQFLAKMVESALICCQTFDIDTEHPDKFVEDKLDASILIQCSILIHDYYSKSKASEHGYLTSILHRRWQQTAYTLIPALLENVIERDTFTYLDHAIKESWPQYQQGDPWKMIEAAKGSHYWVISNTGSQAGQSLQVHYNLLTGELLVNGMPLSRLPTAYETHPTYVELFGTEVFEIMPSSSPGMRFSSKRLYKDQSFQFGMEENDLIVQACREDQTWEALPRHLFQELIPHHFVEEFSHWYNVDKKVVEFRSRGNRWHVDSCTWRLHPISGGWRLQSLENTLVNPTSSTGKALSTILSSLQDPLWINLFVNSGSKTLHIDLPRLKTDFCLEQGTTAVVSLKQRGFSIDSRQSFGTLIGLKTMLVLKHQTSDERKVLIPPGNVSYNRSKDCVQVSILHASTSPHVYVIDELLQKLRDNGSLQSKLFLCYLHALTASCRPDPLTSRTGTEQALSILKSAAVRSFPVLSSADLDLLHKIESLTPRRDYYPQHLTVMQTVRWNAELPSLSQHSHFHIAAEGLTAQAKMAKLYFPSEYKEPSTTGAVNHRLLIRDSSRSSIFRISCFGAEDSRAVSDATYKARDTQQAVSERSRESQLISTALFSRNDGLLRRPWSVDLNNHIWGYLEPVSNVQGPLNASVSPSDFVYDAKWLQDHQSHWANIWCWLHENAQTARLNTQSHRYNVMIWLATMAFASEADLDIIHTVAAMFILPAMEAIRPISSHQLPLLTAQYYLRDGSRVDRSRLQSTIQMSLKPLELCTENSLQRWRGEYDNEYEARKRREHEEKKKQATDQLMDHISEHFPSQELALRLDSKKAFLLKYMYLDETISDIRPLLKSWHDNYQFRNYLWEIRQVLQRNVQGHPSIQPLHIELPDYTSGEQQSFINTDDLFSDAPHRSIPALPRLTVRDLLEPSRDLLAPSRLASLIIGRESKARSRLEIQYASELKHSQQKWASQANAQRIMSQTEIEMSARPLLESHIQESKEYVECLLDRMCACVRSNLWRRDFAESLNHCPRLSSVFFLHQLSKNGWEDGGGWCSLPARWRPWIVAYAMAVTELQRAKRLLQAVGNEDDFTRELQNEGHVNWDPMQHPESLLIEVESNIMIRHVQAKIAEHMMSPPNMQNTVMQLNMGEGKSSVIVPIITAALADTSKLVRVVVAKPQSRQMLRMLVSKLGGMLNRAIYHLPFSRDLRLTDADAANILSTCRRCVETRGVMLVQPEHLLSFKLMGLESFISGKQSIGRCLMATQAYFDANSRDIVDESDENFSVKFELIYTMGTQTLIDFAPERWIVMQTVLSLIKDQVAAVKKQLPLSIEVFERAKGAFPRVRLLKEDATGMLLGRVAQALCSQGFSGFPISRQSPASRDAILKYVTKLDLNSTEVEAVEGGYFWTDTVRTYILLLRGLFARGILAFVFSRKRWRVNYGLDPSRRPPTRLAVPYRAKDSPSPRSEFSHPDVVIALTCTSYYYQGLGDDDLFLAFGHLVDSDQANDEYQAWVIDSQGLASSFHRLMGINLKDVVQCTVEVFPAFRFAKRTIDYFLKHIVFPKHMKEFPQKLSASGWDLGAVKAHPLTGFSGTIDSKRVLPLDVHYLGLPDQEGTNAQVLEYLLRPETEVILLPSLAPASGDVACDAWQSDADALLNVVLGRGDPSLRVILDVGAQILELTNAEMASRWLIKAHGQDRSVQAAIYFNDDEEIMVRNISGTAEPFWTSPYVDQLDVCLVYLDEAHTRGTDLRLPNYYRAAVTLGANLTKDRLVQACMRMRRLGKGQSVIFCIPQEIQTKIRKNMLRNEDGTQSFLNYDIKVEDVLDWAMSETIRDIENSVPLWAVQGRRFERQQDQLEPVATHNGAEMTAKIAEAFLEDEAETVEHRYKPGLGSSREKMISCEETNRLKEIQQRCLEYGTLQLDQSMLEEEQERELSPEIEEERQIERPLPARPASHAVHADLIAFVASGTVNIGSPAFMPAFMALKDTSAANHLSPGMFPRDILVTADFARTVQRSLACSFCSDTYQRPVQWILTSRPRDWKHVIVISPHEAQELLPQIQTSKQATLHVYSARSSQDVGPLDKLDLYTVPSPQNEHHAPFPLRLRTQLNLFAGQLYLGSLSEYIELCKILRISRQEAAEGTVIDADGFIQSSTSSTTAAIIAASTLTKSPVQFLKSFLAKARRDGQSIDKTHLGRILNGELLQPRDFDMQCDNEA